MELRLRRCEPAAKRQITVGENPGWRHVRPQGGPAVGTRDAVSHHGKCRNASTAQEARSVICAKVRRGTRSGEAGPGQRQQRQSQRQPAARRAAPHEIHMSSASHDRPG